MSQKFSKAIKDTKDIIIAAAEDKKAIDIQLIDVRKQSRVADYLVICSATSYPQMKAIADEISDKLKKKCKWEGVKSSNWIILDLGDVIVHVMGIEERSYYKLEDIWEKSGITYHM